MPNRAFLLEDLALLELTGSDRLDWLQGQSTNDVRKLAQEGRGSFCFCEPTGRVLAVFDAWVEEGGILMTVDRQRVPAVLDRIESMTILEDVVAKELPVRGAWLESFPGPSENLTVLPWSFGGAQIWADDSTIDSLLEGCESIDPEPFRIAAGIPRWGGDLGPRTLPPELGPAFEASHISYSKGCYTGQEVLMRMHSRGHTNRTWVGLVSSVPVTVGASVLFEDREVGRITSAATQPLTPGVYVAAAVLRNEACAEGTSVQIARIDAEIRRLPLGNRI